MRRASLAVDGVMRGTAKGMWCLLRTPGQSWTLYYAPKLATVKMFKYAIAETIAFQKQFQNFTIK